MTMPKNFQFMQFIVSVFSIHLKGRDMNDSATIISSVFQENNKNVRLLICQLISENRSQ